MLHAPLKKILVEKLQSGFPCTIRYRLGTSEYEKPFKLGSNNDDLLSSSQVNLVNYITNEHETVDFANISIFSIPHIDDLNSSIAYVDDLAEQYHKASTEFDFIRGDIFYQLVFNVDVIENSHILKPVHGEVNPITYLNLIRSTNIEDHRKLKRGEYAALERLKGGWKTLILKKYNVVLESLDKEIVATDDQNIKQEIEAIKDIIKTIPSDIGGDLAEKKTYEEIIAYWPTLLLPRSTLLDVPQNQE